MRERAYSNLAYEALGQVGFGGQRREVRCRALPEIEGHQATISEARTVVVGKYYGASGGRTYDGDYDYEPGGLSDCVYVRLVSFTRDWHTIEIRADYCRRITD